MMSNKYQRFQNFKADEIEERGRDGFYHRGGAGESDYGRVVIERSELNGVEVVAAEDWVGNKQNVVRRVIVINPL